ncbi:MAG TPA: hypothetical protein VFB13_04900 [Reyranella sp.]|nr:hypothetical protein [Reyranella sp.]
MAVSLYIVRLILRMMVSFAVTWIAISFIWSLALFGGGFDFYRLQQCGGSGAHAVAECIRSFIGLPVLAPFGAMVFSDDNGLLFTWITSMAFPILTVSIFGLWEYIRPIMPARPSKPR